VPAYEQTLRALGLKDRSDPITQLVAEKIIAVGRLGIEDPAEISKLALKELGNWGRWQSIMFTFEHFASHCVMAWNRLIWALAEGKLQDVPIVLVVEDEESLPEIVHDALKDGGFDLTTVASGQEAVAMIESGVVKYSALVTDVNLKGPMKGWEIARLVRQIDPAFPVVYMTGAAADDWASEGVPNSILLKKPFAPAQLVTAVSQLLNTGSPTSG
jgi:CheY-like chemotaxis protein